MSVYSLLTPARRHARAPQLALACLLSLGSTVACGDSPSSPQSSSSTHWLECRADEDCSALALDAVCGNAGYCTSATGQPLEQVVAFEEEFEGSALDTGRFAFELGAGIRNQEVQAYTRRADNVRVEEGALVITARAEDYQTSSFTSGSIYLKSGFVFGRLEVRAQMPLGRGMNASIWMLPTAPGRSIASCIEGTPCYSGTWPAWGDIIVATAKSRSPGQVLHGINYGIWDESVNAVRHAVSLDQESLITEPAAYHVYALEWGPERMAWFVDGQLLSSSALPPPDAYRPEGKNPFHQEFSLRLSLAVGGLDQAPASEDYPAEFRVDSVRLWQWQPQP